MSKRRFSYGGQTEISMRDELINTLDGLYPEISKKQTGLLRTMRRDSSNNLLECACKSNPFNESEKDLYCPLCLGEGYYWDETYIDFYSWTPDSNTALALKEELVLPGNINVPLRVFYLNYSEDLTIDDRMVLLVLNKEGQVVRPYARREIYRLGSVIENRSDNGRLEFWKVVGWVDTSIPLNPR